MTETYWYFFSGECVCWWALKMTEIDAFLCFCDTVNCFCLQNTVDKFHRWMAFHLNILDLDKIVSMQKPLWVRMCPLSNHNLENAFPQILQEHGKVWVLRCIFRAPWLLNVWSLIGIPCRTNVSFSLAFSPSALFALLSPVFPAHFHSNRWVPWCFVTLTIKCFDFFFFFSYLPFVFPYFSSIPETPHLYVLLQYWQTCSSFPPMWFFKWRRNPKNDK